MKHAVSKKNSGFSLQSSGYVSVLQFFNFSLNAQDLIKHVSNFCYNYKETHRSGFNI